MWKTRRGRRLLDRLARWSRFWRAFGDASIVLVFLAMISMTALLVWLAALVVNVPAVVRLRKAFRRHAKPVKFSRVNIYARDGYRCQYCGAKCSIDELTYDHVIPRSRGGRTTWDNIVSCCYACNAEKANRTPVEARMKLLSTPTRPSWIPSVQIRVSTRSVPDAWRDYVYWTGEIDSEDGTGVM